ncbi:hypothetical protein HPB52_017250 [Rhipicephalus sanguineus]|uniref:Uncharacterized protein n=1 Tax=Rhipicephalus sanguineus TaxID=34632 RepID=A0A9D4PH43_RHISA|nr:hypothetical protein HPB52_017250 [Rhipicephalus sanguineus]
MDFFGHSLAKSEAKEFDEQLPGLSRESDNRPNDASSVSQQAESSNEARASSDVSLNNEKDDDEGLSRTWTDDGWHTVLSCRRKKNSNKTPKEPEKGMEKKNEESPGNPSVDGAGESQAKGDFLRRKRRGPPPLPKEDIKVFLRPHKGLTVKNLLVSELSMAVIEACRNTFGGDSILLRVHPGSNIVIMSTPREEVAGRLREISQLKIRGQIHPFNAYAADPEDVLRGIVHGLPPATIQAQAIRYPYKPTVQVCKICRSTGHRTDVCPTPNANVCSKCGASDPNQGHQCTLNCAICGEGHATGDRSVEMPRRKTEWTYAEMEFPQLEQQQQKPPRWFRSDREDAPGKPNLKKTSSSSGEKNSTLAGKGEEEVAAADLTTEDQRANQLNKHHLGYPRDSPKGTRLEHAVSKQGLSLITLPTTPTRDTNWTNLEENLGSDHYIISISFSTPKLRRIIGDVVITDWERFRRRDPPSDSRNGPSQTKAGREILARVGFPPYPQNLDESVL